MLGKIGTRMRPSEQSMISELRQEIDGLKNSRHHLKGELVRMKAEIETLQRKLDTTFQFFEIRVDQIYRNLAMTGLLDRATGEADAALQLPTNPDWERLIFAARSPMLAPGPIPSPITLSGMRIDTRYATEKLHYTQIMGGVSAIAVFGPYRKLLPGEYVLSLSVEPVDPAGAVSLYLEVFTVHDGCEIEVSGQPVHDTKNSLLAFSWGLEWANCEVQFRIHQRAGDAVRLFGLDLTRK